MRTFLVFFFFATATNFGEIRDIIAAGNRTGARDLSVQWVAQSPGGIDRAHALDSLALTWATGVRADSERVRTLTAESLEISRAASDRKAEAEALFVWGFQLSSAGDLKEGREVLELSIAREPDARSREMASELTALASLLNGLTQFSLARSKAEEAVAIGESFPDRDLAESLSVLANIFFTMGDYPGARKHAERSIALFTADPVPGLRVGHAYMILAHILVRLVDFTAANAALEKAIELDARVFGPDSIQVADDLNASGAALADGGNLIDAAKRFRRVLSIYEKVLGPENTSTGGASNNLGQVLILLHEYAEAKQCFERSLAIQIKALGPQSTTTVNPYQGLARVAAATGDYAEARKYFARNLAVWKDVLGPTHASTLNTQSMLADVLARSGDRPGAMTLALEVARLRREYLTDTVRSVSEREALQIIGKRGVSFNSALALAGDSPADTSLAFDELIRSRALVLDEMAARYHAVRKSADPHAAALLDAARKARTDLAHAALTYKDPTLPQKRLALRRAEEALAEGSPVSQDRLRREKAGLAEIAAALPANTALVSYLRYDRPDLNAPDKDPVSAYVAFVLRAGMAPRLVNLGSGSAIDKQVAALNLEITRERDAAGHSERRNEATYRIAGDALRKTIWDPVARVIAGLESVYIVPDAALQVVNFAALPSGPAAGRYLAETGPLLHMLSEERSLLTSPSPVAPGNALLAVGNPSAAPANSVICSGKFGTLPGSQREAAEVASIWKSRVGAAEILTGPQARESALQAAVAGKTALHLATHGFYIDDQCAADIASDNPLLRSGLMLSSGVFTAAQAASLNLDDVDWVVLSGCDTGLGDIRASEGVLGLRRAFEEAGARTVVASLWPVDDEANRAWMASLYRHRFVNREPTAQAMRAAQRQSLTTRRAAGLSTHPYYWAAFIAVERQ